MILETTKLRNLHFPNCLTKPKTKNNTTSKPENQQFTTFQRLSRNPLVSSLVPTVQQSTETTEIQEFYHNKPNKKWVKVKTGENEWKLSMEMNWEKLTSLVTL